MKPAWDKLMEEYAGNANVLVADVDCTAAGDQLCKQHGVRGYPTIKYGDPEELQDYKGPRSYEDLSKFAQENLGSLQDKTELDKLILKVNRAIKPLRADVEHILNFRKNAAALLLGVGALGGMLLGACCCPRRVTVDKSKKDN
eukprot:gb/GFBE01039884.1/.p1 GENE.gb/GFBE01039884.1/~~gb/GFBE01039884.1/.p1  ORF type:complete len:143 (+),score=31.98 gb/GFBE01039884.1/:1-429(+)